MNYNQRRHGRKARSGSAAIETAVALPLLLVMVIGFFEYGWHIHNTLILHNAARQGARAASNHENSTTEVTAVVEDLLHDSIGLESADINVRLEKMNRNGSKDYTISNLSENENGEPVRVIVTVRNNRFHSLSSMFLKGEEDLVVSATAHRHH